LYVAEAGSVDSAGQKRSNDTHESTTDPDARLYKNSYGEESHLAYLGHALVENRNGLIAQAKAHRRIHTADQRAPRSLGSQRLHGSLNTPICVKLLPILAVACSLVL